MRLWHANPPYRLNSSHVSLPDVGRIRIAASSTSELFSKLFLYQLVTYGIGLTKGKLVQEAGVETYYFLISSKKAF